MAQVFPKSSNTLSKASIVVAGIVLGAVGLATININRTTYVTTQSMPIEQVVQFTHTHHVGSLGLDCRFCHTAVEESSYAGIPPSKTCMGCHSVVWKDAPILEPVRESFRNDTSVEWIKVHDLPEFVYFNHSIHVNKGIGCESCHGRVDQMPLMMRQNSLNMEWCLACHRAPEQFLRPKDQIYTMGWDPEKALGMTQAELGAKLKLENNVQSRTNCATCHR
ncbi:MAG: cytochrome c3 family protein [Planctomycetes bacterium]|nr:cytochrome c3 family protein [Planctomycetota bacterium]